LLDFPKRQLKLWKLTLKTVLLNKINHSIIGLIEWIKRNITHISILKRNNCGNDKT
jgi:hypothetical protein